jgi:hypothetical protein
MKSLLHQSLHHQFELGLRGRGADSCGDIVRSVGWPIPPFGTDHLVDRLAKRPFEAIAEGGYPERDIGRSDLALETASRNLISGYRLTEATSK